MRHAVAFLYRQQPAVSDELRWALRSLRHLTDCDPTPLLIGDRPPWYTGPALPVPPTRRESRRSHVRRQLCAALDSGRLADRFVVLADDNALLAPITFDDLWTPRHWEPRGGPSSDGWNNARWLTRQWCEARWPDRPFRDVSTHWPYGWEAGPLRETLAIMPDPLLLESVYANHHAQPSLPQDPDLQYIRTARPPRETTRVISYGNASFRRSLRAYLMRRFNEPSPWEEGVTAPAADYVDASGAVLACAHLGPVQRLGIGQPVFACALHTECVLMASPDARACQDCTDWQEPPVPRLVTIGDHARRRARNAPPADDTPAGPGFFRAYPCPHRGGVARIVDGRPCMTGRSRVEVRRCAIHGLCSSVPYERPQPAGVQPCSTCRHLPDQT